MHAVTNAATHITLIIIIAALFHFHAVVLSLALSTAIYFFHYDIDFLLCIYYVASYTCH